MSGEGGKGGGEGGIHRENIHREHIHREHIHRENIHREYINTYGTVHQYIRCREDDTRQGSGAGGAAARAAVRAG